MRWRQWSVLGLVAAAVGCQSDIPHGRPLRLMTYSIQYAAGGLDRIKAEIASYEPDILCLQGAKLEAHVNQVVELANHFGYYRAFGKAVDLDKGQDINGILCRYKVADARVIDMPSDRNLGLAVRVAWPSQDIWVVSMALTPNRSLLNPIALTQDETLRARQADRINEVASKLAGPVIVAGTLHSTPLSIVYQRMAARWTDCHFSLDALAPATYPNFVPLYRFDYVFASEHFYPSQAQISSAGASDHRAVIVDLYLKAVETQPAATAWAHPFRR